jgi:hypothetical protein
LQGHTFDFRVGANPNLTHPANPILTRGWMPTG